MKIAGSVALVTGANRGLGRHFAQQLLQRGHRDPNFRVRSYSERDRRCGRHPRVPPWRS